MADKTSFTKDEWTLLLESPMIAGMAITAAEPSGLWGLLKESFAGGTALTRAVDRLRHQCAGQVGRHGLFQRRRAKRRARWPESKICEQQAG